MKTCIIKHPVSFALLTAGLGLIMLAEPLIAQTFTTLHSFPATPPYPGPYTNSDGANPENALVLSGRTLYGTTPTGGTAGNGTVFAVNTDGTGFTTLHTFTGGNDGAYPYAGLTLSGNTLYGTTPYGGSSSNGTVFKVNTDGTGFATLYSFAGFTGCPFSLYCNSDGANPFAGLVLSGNSLYGTTEVGGSSAAGTVFAVNTDSTGFANLHTFTSGSDGGNPCCRLVLLGNTLYGTTQWITNSGASGNVFAVNTNGTDFTSLHTFGNYPSDGAKPFGGLALSGNTLYGTAVGGGGGGYGTVFKVNTDGSGYTTLHSFPVNDGLYPYAGGYPYAGLILSGGTLYGTAIAGGRGCGTVFALNTDGTGFTTLHSFTGGSDGRSPYGGLILSGNTLYGTTQNGGSSDSGTLFSLSFTPHLTIILSGANVVLTWPTNYAGFDYTGYILLSTTNLVSPMAWTTNSPQPVVINGENTVTNPITGTQQFFRLSQ